MKEACSKGNINVLVRMLMPLGCIIISSFTGNAYFCDTGNCGPWYSFTTFYLNDPLWDCERCGSTSSCCEFNSPPWFCKSLRQPTTDDLEIRLCCSNVIMDESKIESSIDIYVV